MIPLLASFMLALAPASAGGAQPEPPPEAAAPSAEVIQQLEDIDARLAEIKDLRASFEQRKHTPLLKKPLVSRGTVLLKPDATRWDTTSPRASSMTISKGLIRIYYPDARVVEEFEATADLREISGAPLPKLAFLKEHFDLAPIDAGMLGAPKGDARYLALNLTPRTPALKDRVASVQALIDIQTPCITRIVMTDPDGERTETIFSEIRVNTGVRDDDLTLQIPQGTRISRPGASPPAATEPAR